jgi:hypothetical protein
MIDIFKEEMFWMMREGKALIPSVQKDGYHLRRLLFSLGCHPFCFERYNSDSYRELIGLLVRNVVLENELIDLFLKALIRAEIRFVSRYVPQRSNEERLTGNLVSEIDNAIFLIKDSFRKLSMDRYSEVKEIDFYYYDLSRGGKIEKTTGADLGFIFVIDLPDFPYTVRSITLQAKSVRGNRVQIDIPQYEVLKRKNGKDCAYLFYDMNFETLSSPIVKEIDSLEHSYKESKENQQDSFSIDFDRILSGSPLSIYLVKSIIYNKYGRSHSSFKDSYSFFEDMCYSHNKNMKNEEFRGRIGIVSLGKSIHLESNQERMRISIG